MGGPGLNFDAKGDLMRITRSCKQLPFKSWCPWGPTFLRAFFVRAKNKVLGLKLP